jgi:hypothetical protein
MNPLRLSPLPPICAANESESRRFEREGFVDEAVVAAMARPLKSGDRTMACPQDLILAADDLDFAGWQVPAAAPWLVRERNPVMASPLRRPAPPLMREPGLGRPHPGAHRWWLAGLAGVLSTMLFSLLLLTLATRPDSDSETLPPQQAESASPVPAAASSPKAVPDLAETAVGKPRTQRGD